MILVENGVVVSCSARANTLKGLPKEFCDSLRYRRRACLSRLFTRFGFHLLRFLSMVRYVLLSRLKVSLHLFLTNDFLFFCSAESISGPNFTQRGNV